MSNNNKLPNDSFLPSGAIDLPTRTFNIHDSGMSPLSGVPRTIPETIFLPASQLGTHSSSSPQTMMASRTPPQHTNGLPLSPPRTRSASAENTTVALMEDWRAYASKLRVQFDGEKAHMQADRKRMEELMAEEREVWDRERILLFSRISQLEVELAEAKAGHEAGLPQTLSSRAPISNSHGSILASESSNARSASGSMDSSSQSIPQETGRNADGTPFYAPAPRNPRRTFDSSETSELRVDDIIAPRDIPICVTSKVLGPTDFIQSPLGTFDLESIPEITHESIDISQIQPNLEGIHIKASAVNPSFVAQIISPGYTPSVLSPAVRAPSRPEQDDTMISPPEQVDTTASPPSKSPPSRKSASPEEKAADKERKTLQVAAQPEHGRLTIHAGHTPSHSITKLKELFAIPDSTIAEADEDPTPRQRTADHSHHPSMAQDFYLGGDSSSDDTHNEDGDAPLTGPLGLINDPAVDNSFLQQLHSKLEEAKRSEGNSPASESGDSIAGSITSNRSANRAMRSMRGSQETTNEEKEDEEKEDEGPRLRLKPSLNFGRPMGKF
jgi:hypothetical protein